MSYNLTEIPGDFSGKHPLAAATVIQIGGLTALNAAGNAVPAAAAVTGHVIGRAYEDVDNAAGAIADKEVTAKRGIFGCKNSDAVPVNKTHVGKMVFAETPDIVRATGTCRAGILIGFDESDRPLVDTRFSDPGTTVTLASSNGTAAAAADLTALKTETEKIGDDLRAIHAALVTKGILTA